MSDLKSSHTNGSKSVINSINKYLGSTIIRFLDCQQEIKCDGETKLCVFSHFTKYCGIESYK